MVLDAQPKTLLKSRHDVSSSIELLPYPNIPVKIRIKLAGFPKITTFVRFIVVPPVQASIPLKGMCSHGGSKACHTGLQCVAICPSLSI